jgi:hypothetical protein
VKGFVFMSSNSDPGVPGPPIPAPGGWQPTIWAFHCPFRKEGSPVLGSFGATVRPVVILPMETWTRLCREIPALGAMQFNVGSED